MTDATPPQPQHRASRLRALWNAAWVLRTRNVIARVRDYFPWTALGLGLGLGSYAALRAFAYAQLDLVWLVTGYAAVGLCALSPLFVVAGAIYLRFFALPQLSSDALSLETGSPTSTGFALPSLRFFPLTQLRWQWLAPTDTRVEQRAQRGMLEEHVSFDERGKHERIERRVIVEDPFGLARVAFRLRQSRTQRVLPRVGALRHLPPLVSLAAGTDLPHPMGVEDGDRLELQRYSPGDPARFIHWKVFARTRRLMVRKPERAIAIARRCAAFYIASPNDDATAAVARLAIERGLLGNEWVFGTDLDVGGTSRVDVALEALVVSGNARELNGRGLHAFLAKVEKQGPASVVVFAPAQSGPWMDIVTTAARRRHVRAVIGVDGLSSERPRSWWARWFALAEPSFGAQLDALEQVVGTLSRAGISFSVLDRATGRPLGDIQRRALGQAGKPVTAASERAAALGGAA